MKIEEKLAHKRSGTLKLAETRGNVRETCCQQRMVPSQFCEYKKRFQEQGLGD